MAALDVRRRFFFANLEKGIGPEYYIFDGVEAGSNVVKFTYPDPVKKLKVLSKLGGDTVTEYSGTSFTDADIENVIIPEGVTTIN